MPHNWPSFEQEVTREGRKLTQDDLVLLHRQIAFDALSRVILKTPFDTGVTRNNWQIEIGGDPSGQIEAADKTGAQAIARGQAKLAALQPYALVVIGNLSDHILVLELGQFQPPNPGPSKDPRPDRKGKVLVRDGYSVQAPQGMVAVTLEELRSQFG